MRLLLCSAAWVIPLLFTHAHSARAQTIPIQHDVQATPIAPPLPSLRLLTSSVPENGALVFQSSFGTDVATITGQDGLNVAGVWSYYGGALAVFRPNTPWLAGQTYSVSVPLNYGSGTPHLDIVTVVAAENTALPSLNLSLMLRTQISEDYLSCYTDADRATVTNMKLSHRYTTVVMDASSDPGVLPSTLTQQLLVGLVLPNSPAAFNSQWPLMISNSSTEGLLPKVCAQLQVLDLRTMQTSTGAQVCATSSDQNKVEDFDIEAQLRSDVCPAPDYNHVSVWCLQNQSTCVTQTCANYAALCLPPVYGSADAGVPPSRDGGVATADAGRADSGAAADAAALAEAAHDGGCSLGRGPAPQNRGLWLFAALLGMAAVRPRKRRAP